MGLTMKERKAVSKEITKRYQKATKKEKGRILDEFVKITTYTRCYASWLLRNWKREFIRRLKNGDRLVLVKDPALKQGRCKPLLYSQKVFQALKKVWEILNYPCGKRLAPFLKEVVPVLEGHQEIALEPEVREKILQISAASIDRLLKEEKKRWQIKGKVTTKPGSLLKSQIPVRTYSEWDENKPGFIEVDLVGHDGGTPDGIYSQTLTATDIATGWTETIAVKNKAQVWVFEGLQTLTRRFPFPILGIDSDNGGEFINHHLLEYCQAHGVTFTRSRPYRKNDTCYVEQKNYTVVRKMVGYLRYETQEELELMNRLYRLVSFYTNFFQPSAKLIKKTRVGSKVKKVYDLPKTPYQRVKESPQVTDRTKEILAQGYAKLNPAALKRTMVKLQGKLFELAPKKQQWIQKEVEKKKNFVYNLPDAPNYNFI